MGTIDYNFNELVELIHSRLKIDCREYNEGYIKRRISARLMACSLPESDYRAYIAILNANALELRSLYDTLTVNVTQFFRDTSLWGVVASDVFPRILNEKRARSEKDFTIWSCGCASGEEPYTLAILLNECMNAKGVRGRIIATDIDEQSLQKARAGIYDGMSLRDMNPEYIAKYFTKVQVKGKEKFEVKPSLKNAVQFVEHNFLVDAPPQTNLDLILCRNVIIYFTPVAKDKLMGIFRNSLTGHGWLIIGKSEVLFTPQAQHYYYLYNSEERVYRKERRVTQGKVEVDRRKNWWPGYGKQENS